MCGAYMSVWDFGSADDIGSLLSSTTTTTEDYNALANALAAAGTSQNSQSAAQGSALSTSNQFSSVVTNTTMLAQNPPGAAYSMGANVTYTVFGPDGLPCFSCAGDPVMEQVNYTNATVLSQNDGVTVSAADTLAFAIFFTTVDSNGQFTDPVGEQAQTPFTMNVNNQNLYIINNNNLYPVYSGISYVITGTGPYQGSMQGSNGVVMPVP